jgi:signal transduction histidine kinase
MSTSEDGTVHQIRARSHLLQLLGEELIGDDRLAIFELVKNGYDADATRVNVAVNVNGSSAQSIVVQDSGTGMTLNDITGKWLELATDAKRKDRSARTKRFRRLALGEKGVGRIASFKLGRYVTLTTRSEGQPEYETKIDWDQLLDQGPYLENLSVRVRRNTEPKVFEGRKTGTRIEISGLRRKHWTRGDLRKLYRLVTSLASPFHTPDQFKVDFSTPGRESDVEDLISPNDFLDHAVWKFHFVINRKSFDWKYSFNPPHWKGVKPRSEQKKGDRLSLTPESDQDGLKRSSRDRHDALLLAEDDLKDIGPIEGNIYGYYRRSEVLNATGNSSQLKTWLDDQTGVRVYRDGVRVFTYGEKNDDWLGLNVRRINTPAGKLGTNSVVAAIHLELDESRGLKEKTNREGFDQNEAFDRLKRIVLSAVEHLERLHADDRKALDDVIKGTTQEKPVRFSEAIGHLRTGLKDHKLDKSFGKDVDTIEQEFIELRDVMVNAGTAGLNLAVIFHEIEREVDALATAVERGTDNKSVREQIEHLYQLLHGFAPLLKKNPTRLIFASDIVRAASRIRESRFKFHKVTFSAPLLQKEEPDFRVRGPSNLLTGALGNLLDNALYWARYRKERDERTLPGSVLVASDWDRTSNSGMIAVVDNGPGFSIPLTRAKEAFFTTRPGGMGLGLYFANLVMEQCGGELTIHTASDLRDEISIPKAFDGAAVAMRFRESA